MDIFCASLQISSSAHFPQVLTIMVLLAWLAMADIMDNPYGFNKFYDLQMTDKLELNIWRCSLAIQNQSTSRIPLTTEEERRQMDGVQVHG